MKINDLVFDYLEENGFNTKEWDQSVKVEAIFDYKNDNLGAYFRYYYVIIPGLYRLIITTNESGGSIKLVGIPGFEMIMDVRNPDSLLILVEKLKKLYIWMKNINSEHARRLTHESARYNSRAIIRNS